MGSVTVANPVVRGVIRIAGGRSMGRVTLVNGQATVPAEGINAQTLILLTCQNPGGTPGFLRVASRNGSEFVIQSSSNSDTSVVGWFAFQAV